MYRTAYFWAGTGIGIVITKGQFYSDLPDIRIDMSFPLMLLTMPGLPSMCDSTKVRYFTSSSDLIVQLVI